MKKIITLLLSAVLLLSLVACSSGTVERDLPEGDYSDMGAGIMYVVTDGGSSDGGNVPVMYVDSGTTMTQIGLEAWEFNGAQLSYIYIDGIETDKQQLSESQITLTLQDHALTEGVHVVEVVQYEGDDPAEAMVTYKKTSYEVKSSE